MENNNQGKPNRYAWKSKITIREWIVLVIAVISIFSFLYMADKVHNERNVNPPTDSKNSEVTGGIENPYEYRSNHMRRAKLPLSFCWSNANRRKYSKQIKEIRRRTSIN